MARVLSVTTSGGRTTISYRPLPHTRLSTGQGFTVSRTAESGRALTRAEASLLEVEWIAVGSMSYSPDSGVYRLTAEAILQSTRTVRQNAQHSRFY